MKRVLFVIGSLRKESFNRQLAKAAEEMLAGKAEVSYLDYEDIPFMNQDIEWPTPASVQRIRDMIPDYDALWIFTPEYNYNIPGVLKNLLDWRSRPIEQSPKASSAVKGVKVTISGIGGRNATKNVRASLSGLLSFMGMEVIGGDGVGLAVNPEAWTSNVIALSPEDMDQLAQQADQLVNAIQA